MDRSKLLALFGRRPAQRAVLAAADPVVPRSPEAVYQAARVIRGRIDAALAASRIDAPAEGLPR